MQKQQKAPGLGQGPKLQGQGSLGPFQAAAFAAAGSAALSPMQPMPMLDDHGGASVGGIGGPVGQLLDQNLTYLNQFRTNMHCFKVQLLLATGHARRMSTGMRSMHASSTESCRARVLQGGSFENIRPWPLQQGKGILKAVQRIAILMPKVCEAMPRTGWCSFPC